MSLPPAPAMGGAAACDAPPSEPLRPVDLTRVWVYPPELVLQRKCATCGAPIQSGCESCSAKKKQIQTKLRIGEAGDALEVEADRAADQVLAGESAPAASVKQRLAAPSASLEAPAVVGDVLGSSGQPLDAATREFFEPRFSYDLSHVRVHTDAAAAASARAVGALAYTVASHIVFDSAQFSPGTPHGRRLLAHELAHTIQQNTGRAAPYLARQPNNAPASEEKVVGSYTRGATEDDAPWFVYYDSGTKRSLLPEGSRVETQGPPKTSLGIEWQELRLISRPDRTGDPSLGKKGSVRAKFLVTAPAKAPEAKPEKPAEQEPAPAPDKPAAAPTPPSDSQRALDAITRFRRSKRGFQPRVKNGRPRPTSSST